MEHDSLRNFDFRFWDWWMLVSVHRNEGRCDIPSSDKWLIQSGVPTANAALSSPVMKQIPSDQPPVRL